ncbi:hypothetical protein [Nocardia sp. NPDC059239]|uniref:hypothetical protein n=1 Tax=unclassified Nocardia TaxID=2637762 RepID=UPI0036A33164
MADGDAFTNLRNDGQKGVYFDSGAAQTMAQQAADMLTVVNAAMALVQPETNLQPFNQRDSGRMLADKLNAATQRLGGTVAKDHVEVLTSMGEAFVGANKAYADADQTSAVNFDQNVRDRFTGMHASGQPGLATSPLAALTQHVDSVSLPGWGQSNRGNVYEWSGTSKDDYSNKLQSTDQAGQLSSAAKAAGIALDGKQITPEPGSQYGWDDFHNHWQYIHDSTILSVLAQHAQDWKTASAYIKSQASTFSAAKDQYLTGYQGDNSIGDKIWASDAAKQARDGIGHYLDNVKTLTDSMDLMSVNLAFAEGWLKKLQNFLPYKSISQTTELVAAGESAVEMPISQSSVDEAMNEMRQAWDEWYGNGVRDSSGAVPIIPDPKAAVSITPPDPAPTDQPDPNAKQPAGTPTTQTPTTQTPNIDNPDGQQPTNTDPKDTDPKKTDTPTTTTDTTLQTLITQASTVLQAGITAAEQGVEKLASAVETALTQTQTTTKTTDPTDQLTQQLQNLGLIPNTDTPGGTPTGGSPTGGTPTSPGSPQTPKTQIAPRSANQTTTTETDAEETTTSRAGLASTSSASSSGSTGGMGGSPMSAGSQGQGKEHKRPQFLTNLDNLEEVLGEAPAAVTPVAEK